LSLDLCFSLSPNPLISAADRLFHLYSQPFLTVDCEGTADSFSCGENFIYSFRNLRSVDFAYIFIFRTKYIIYY